MAKFLLVLLYLQRLRNQFWFPKRDQRKYLTYQESGIADKNRNKFWILQVGVQECDQRKSVNTYEQR
jgi:hypothetical protein